MGTVSLPERASRVKGLLAGFLRARSALESGKASFLVLARCWDFAEESVQELGCRGHLLRGCSRRSFLCGGTPTHPFVNPSAETGSRSGQGRPDTEYALRPSRKRQPSQSELRSASKAESTGTLRLAFASAGASSGKEGPMQPSFSPTRSSLRFGEFLPRLFYTCSVR